MLNIIDDWNFGEAFTVACRDGINVAQGSKCDNSSFSVEDVSYTLAHCHGENDEASWLWVGVLQDGRYAFVSAWCDYTGWG